MNGKLILKKAIANIVAKTISGTGTKGSRILNYHSVPAAVSASDDYQMTTPKDIFAEQMRYLAENKYNVVLCEEVVENILCGRPMRPRTVALTFDDGFKDNLANAFPVLERYGFKATMFLSTDIIGKNEERLDWDDILFLAKSGVFSFGAHSATHRKLAGLGKAELEEEISVPKKALEQFLKKPVEFFAYPFGCYGSFDDRAVEILKSSGYKAAFTTITGYNTIRANPFTLKRMRISWFDDRTGFANAMIGAYDWYELWQRLTRTP